MLIGGHEFTEGCSFDQLLLDELRPSAVHILPTAAAFQNPGAALENARSYFANLGYEIRPIYLLNRSDAFKPEVVGEISRAELLYMIGGSPMHLRSVLRSSPAFETIVGAWENGTCLVGSSASAMVLGDPMIDPRGGALTIGLGVLNNLAILCHAEEWSESTKTRTISLVRSPNLLVTIDSKTALILDTEIRALGEGRVQYLQDAKELPPDAGADQLLSRVRSRTRLPRATQ